MKIPGISQAIDAIGDLGDFLKGLEKAKNAKPGDEVPIKGLAHGMKIPLLGNGTWELSIILRREKDRAEGGK